MTRHFGSILIILLAAVVLPASAHAYEYYIHGIGGWSNYYLEGEQWDGPEGGLIGGIQASDPLSFELVLQHEPVGHDSYYFIMLASRYRFLKADFFMEPGVDFHAGILIPSGEKDDVDGVLGLGLSFLYRTHYNIEFGPRISSTMVFAGPHQGLMMSYTAVIGYRFR